ncbi:hypothetical protein BDP55DRAFT_720985 [Colletotrichum godetiae]|uniref:Uncharacterized protein n=1 Tax=Colletotrichum godetiae TaxID=1209918 RepID=A0AAJ0A7L5_9PEZI|nr:uncharacterized protein BDP55DRAFT_720985 [Colletotrichum godetiae]KAK1658011.1 hypothetical protein BDP55DRAFT_720985 [Colletotrichum godetiae]
MAPTHTSTQLSHQNGALQPLITSKSCSSPNEITRDIDAEVGKACIREEAQGLRLNDPEKGHDTALRCSKFGGKGDDTVTVLSNDFPIGPSLSRRLTGCACGETKKPKAITRTSFWKHSKVELAVHIAALALTAFGLWLGWEERYWFALEGPSPDRGINTDVVINLLQLPAKLHEILIVASLSFIFLAMCRRRLIGGGVRLGFLTGAYRVGDLEYILAPSSPLWHMGIKHLSFVEVVLACYLVFSTLMSTVVGPVSVFMLIPTLERFPLDHASAFSEITTPISLPSADLRRDLVHTTAGFRKTSLSTTPSHFLLSILGLFQQLVEDNDVGVLSHSSRYNLKARLVDYNDTEDDSKDKPIFQPFVQSKCQVYNIASVSATNEKLAYPTDALNCFGHPECQTYKLNPPGLEDLWWTRSIQHNSTFTSGYSIDGDQSSIIKIVGKLSNPKSTAGDLVFTCGLLASLIPSSFSMTSSQEGNTFHSAFNSKDRMNETFHQNSLDTGHVITVNETWLRYVNPNITASISDDWNNNSTAFYKLIRLFSGSSEDSDEAPAMPLTELGPNGAEYLLSTVFGVYLTETLARTGAGAMTTVDLEADGNQMSGIDLTRQYNPQHGLFNVHPLNETHTKWDYGTKQSVRDITLDFVYNEMLPSRLSLDFDVERFGFGTGHPRKTLTFARAIMYIYIGVVCLYALTVESAHFLQLLGREQRFWVQGIEPSSRLHELFILALRLSPPNAEELADIGAGVSSPKLWQKRLRARGDRFRHVCLVLDDETQTERLDVNGKVKYY